MQEGEKVTPMMKQFLELKEQYDDCILLFRAGDFYETFYEDAKRASRILGITLTKRGGTPMAGVPYHSIMPYIRKLVQNNMKIAICEQLEDPKKAKGLVKRGVTRVITPGTVLEDEYLPNFENNFMMCIYAPKNLSEKFGVALADITTGEFLTSQITKLEDIKTLIRKYSPNEIVLNEDFYVKGLSSFIDNNNIYKASLSDIRFNLDYANEILKKQFGLKGEELGLSEREFATIASGALLFYIYKLQKLDLSHINSLKNIVLNDHMIVDAISLRNLEVVENLYSKDKKKTLFGILNNTKTAGGARMLKKHLISPLLKQKLIENRLDSIEECNNNVLLRDEIRSFLENFSDIERITSRITSELVSPKDLHVLKTSLQQIPELKFSLKEFSSFLISKLKKIPELESLVELLGNAIPDNAPTHTRDIGYINKTYHKELEELFNLAFNSKDFIKQFEEKQRKETQITTLKIKFNKIFGYYIEIPRSQESKVPQNYLLKQTLANAHRYTKPELQEKEQLILNAEEKIKALEEELFKDLILKLKPYTKQFQEISRKIALLDVITTHSFNAQIYNYSKPQFSDDTTNIIEGRNPIVEHFVTHYIPNDTKFTPQESFKIITGPNMAGKSTYLRQNALIILMAQSGSYVPAQKATVKLYDRIFTRIGAHDELAEGQSTFMVEMSETANILSNATPNSFIILDEIGRGTSTYDGLAIAWAVTEDLHDLGADTEFATHYHELNSLSEMYPKIENYNSHVLEEGDKIEFLRKIVKGGTDKSYGIYVGKIAGLPSRVLKRAQEIQEKVESKEEIKATKKTTKKKEEAIGKGLGGYM